MNIKLCTVNLITMLRVIGTILLIPIYHVYGSLTTGIFSLICNLTDILDGTLARKWKVSTFFGSLFDSASDKIFLIVNFIGRANSECLLSYFILTTMIFILLV